MEGLLLRIKQKRIRKGPLEKAGRSGQYSAQHCAISLLWAQLYVPLPESDWVFTHTNAFPQQRAISPYLKMGFKKILNYLYKEGTKKKKKESERLHCSKIKPWLPFAYLPHPP